jgi:hypothetical protein
VGGLPGHASGVLILSSRAIGATQIDGATVARLRSFGWVRREMVPPKARRLFSLMFVPEQTPFSNMGRFRGDGNLRWRHRRRRVCSALARHRSSWRDSAMNTNIIPWRNRFNVPEVDRPVVFDFGHGPIFGAFDGIEFFSLTAPGFWDRLLINRWCYREHYMPIEKAA